MHSGLGYNNAFSHGAMRGPSVGLGGNIGDSLRDFVLTPAPFTASGNAFTSGNGSVMRLAPVAIFYQRNLGMGLRVAAEQSKTTHQGDEAAECCRLLTYLLIQAIRPGTNTPHAPERKGFFGRLQRKPQQPSKSTQPKSLTKEPVSVAAAFLDQAMEGFTSRLYAVECLAKSKKERRHAQNSAVPQQEKTAFLSTREVELQKARKEGKLPPLVAKLDLKERDWNWKNPEYRYAPGRSKENPGYIGSYVMDCMAMALHCVYSTNSFTDALLKSANLGGDADTVSAVTGQLAGSVYGVSNIRPHWIQLLQQWDGQGNVALTAYKLATEGPR